MRAIFALAALLLMAAAPTTETIVLIRHGEKPDAGLGQLTCQGLNRALALPPVIQQQFGRPDAIFAPNTVDLKPDDGVAYSYVRPLATVEPTAIAMGLPVHAEISGAKTPSLQKALEAAEYRGSLVLVSWEHHEIVKLAKSLLKDHGGQPGDVPDWKGSDFDSIYVVRLSWTGDKAKASFEHRAEQLDGQSSICPGPAPR